MEAAESNDLRQLVIAIISMVVALISAVTFIMWFRRAYFNLHSRVSKLSFTEGWAAGAWFVPIVNLGRPLNIMQELYNKTAALLKEKDS